jgi:hypothetical protein
MTRSKWLAGFSLCALLAAPASADKVVTVLQHTDEMSMMGKVTPAQDVIQEFWYGSDGLRMDSGDTTTVMRLDRKKLYLVNHDEKNYSALDIPIDFKQLVGPEMAPMMDQMMKMMAATVTVTPTDRTGEFAGFACKFVRVDISMSMMQMAMDQCVSETMPIDYSRYKSLLEAQGELAANAAWIKELAEKVSGFPVRSESTTTVMGKSFKSWQELKSVEDRTPAPGFYEPPAGYQEIKFDPMAAAARQGKRN